MHFSIDFFKNLVSFKEFNKEVIRKNVKAAHNAIAYCTEKVTFFSSLEIHFYVCFVAGGVGPPAKKESSTGHGIGRHPENTMGGESIR